MYDIISELEFFEINKKYKKMSILKILKDRPKISQKELSEILKVSISMINQYIKELEKDGFISLEKYTLKDVKYIVTEKGKERYNYLLISHINELYNLFDLVNDEMSKLLNNIKNEGYNKILLYGAGETAKVILKYYNNSNDMKLNIIGLIDDDPDLLNQKLMEFEIKSLNDFHVADVDQIIITTFAYKDNIIDKLKFYEVDSSKYSFVFDFK